MGRLPILGAILCFLNEFRVILKRNLYVAFGQSWMTPAGKLAYKKQIGVQNPEQTVLSDARIRAYVIAGIRQISRLCGRRRVGPDIGIDTRVHQRETTRGDITAMNVRTSLFLQFFYACGLIVFGSAVSGFTTPAQAQDAFFEFSDFEEGREASRERDRMLLVYFYDPASGTADDYNHIWRDPLVTRFVDKLAVTVVISADSESGEDAGQSPANPAPTTSEGRQQIEFTIRVTAGSMTQATEFLDELRSGPRLLNSMTAITGREPSGDVTLRVTALTYVETEG